MKSEKALSLLCITGFMVTALVGCGSGGTGTTSAAATATDSAGSAGSSDYSSSEIVGQVQTVEDKTVTLLLGELTDAGQGQSGAPAGQANSSDSTGAAAPSGPAAPTGTARPSATGEPSGGGQPSGPAPSGNQPSGGSPNGQPGGGKIFTAGTETKAITITDDTVIKVESASGETDGSMDDIKEGAILEVTLGDNNTATAVTVKNGMTGNPAAPSSTDAKAPAANSSSPQTADN